MNQPRQAGAPSHSRRLSPTPDPWQLGCMQNAPSSPTEWPSVLAMGLTIAQPITCTP